MKRKVLVVIHQLNIGGAQKALLSALQAIDYSQNEVTLYVRKDRLDLLESLPKEIHRVIVNRDNTKYYRKPRMVWLQGCLAVEKLLKKNTEKTQTKLNRTVGFEKMKYEKKHCFSDSTEYDVAVSYIQGYTAQFVAQYIQAKRKVLFYHNSTDDLHDVNCAAMPHFESIYCVSRPALQAVSSFYPEFAHKMECLENVVDVSYVKEQAKAFSPQFPQETPILCSCGRLTSVKGFDLAVKTAALLRDRGIGFHWFFVGDGPERARIEGLIAENNLTDCITITGMQENPYPYIAECDLYVQPSYEEAHPLSIIEAQILGRSVVSTATAGGQALIQDGVDGLVTAIDAAALCEGIARVLEDASLQKTFSETLSLRDYGAEQERFRARWAALLEGKA